tara:strand:+ start:475 stop:1218 length:744 start_codon:yes stop_codon:yes gene_type:complete
MVEIDSIINTPHQKPPKWQDQNHTNHKANMSTDLSSYEIARLQRIKENKAVLEQIGLRKLKKKQPKPSKQAATIKKAERAKRKRATKVKPAAQGSRRSKRLKGQEADNIEIGECYHPTDDPEQQEEEIEPVVNYVDGWPTEPAYLDDYEFQIYAELRKWRLMRKKELEIEPYKICQNRTLCELIRRRRNNSKYATSSATVETDLLKCWGIGPSKAREEGFGREMLDVMDGDVVVEWFEQSRKLISEE